jgi:CDP-diacylglycerol---serine O-phosphatidyltransferase
MIKKHLPNTITLANLTCGCIGIVVCTKGDLATASYMIWLAAMLDFLDGFVARVLKVSSPIGKELDSLADMVTFGVLPAFILFSMQENITSGYLPYSSFTIVLFSALRLAKFNIDTNQSHGFIGIPTPATAFFISGLPFWPVNSIFTSSSISFVLISIVLSLLMVAPIPMLALKFKDYSIGNNIYRYLVVIISVGLIVTFGRQAFPIIISFYIAMSLFVAFMDKHKQQ